MGTQVKDTFCRICEPLCPMRAELNEQGEVVKLVPNREHPISTGFSCHKGLSFTEVHHDPDRANYPMRRRNPRTEAKGDFERVSWDEALTDIGKRLTALKEKYGADSIGTYYGNPIAFNIKAFLPAVSLAAKLGSRRCFGASTQDMANKPVALAAMYGSSQWTIPDFANTDFLLCVGGNPKVSHWTLVSTPNAMGVLRDIHQRGGKVVFVNPRKIESSTPKTGEVLQVKPDSDVYLLAALIHHIDQRGGFDDAIIAKYGKRIDELRAFVGQYPAPRVADVVGVSAEQITGLAEQFMAARSASVYMATGVNQSRQGTLAYWLLNMLSFVTGNLGKPGGNYYARGFLLVSTSEVASTDVFFDTPLGEMRHSYGALPGNLMADFMELEEKDNPVRALIVLSGNPLLSISGEQRLRKAFEKLELIVCIDLYRNATGEMADYVLPASDWLEREDINHVGNGAQPKPYLHYTDAVVAPKYERKNDWWILSRLDQELGLGEVEGDPGDGGEVLDGFLSAGNLDRAALRAEPFGSKLLEPADKGDFFDYLLRHPDKKVDCCPEIFSDSLVRAEAIFTELASEPRDLLKLISLRTNYMHNGALANMGSLKREKHAENALHICPADARERGLEDGATVRVFNDNGALDTTLKFDDSLRSGVVAMSHGYGHQHAGALSRAQARPGVNVNQLLPTGPGSYEKLSNMSHMNGVVVQVEARL